MAKAETDLANARDIYTTADNTLRDRLPLLLEAIYSLLPQLLATQIQLQNTILANYYTILYNFAEDYQFESPPPSMEQIVQEWELSLFPVRDQIESCAILANGKAIKQQQQQSQSGSRASRNPSLNITNSNNNTRPASRASSITTATNYSGRRSSTDTHYTAPSQGLPSPEADRDNGIKPSPALASKPRIPTLGNSSLAVPSASHYLPPSASPTPSVSSNSTYTTPSATTPMTMGFSPAGPKTGDYFASSHRFKNSISSPSATPITPGSDISPGQQSSVAFAAAAVAKKKPPPPPKPKAAGSAALFVTALYDFAGQGEGDLAFYEGDRIRVVHKTDRTDDWWEGEIRGVRGSFPANYVE